MMMTQLLLNVLSDDLRRLLFCQWLDVRSLVTLDVAVSSFTSRPYHTGRFLTGTHDLKDWVTNAYLAAGKLIDTNRHVPADNGLKKVKLKYGVSIYGHSLGGTIAGYIGEKGDRYHENIDIGHRKVLRLVKRYVTF